MEKHGGEPLCERLTAAISPQVENCPFWTLFVESTGVPAREMVFRMSVIIFVRNSFAIAPLSMPSSPVKLTLKVLLALVRFDTRCHKFRHLDRLAPLRATRKNWSVVSTLAQFLKEIYVFGYLLLNIVIVS